MIENIKQIWTNLPLTLSNTKDPADISIDRVLVFICLSFLLLSVIIMMVWLPNLLKDMLSYWQSLLAFVGGLLFNNTGKKLIDTKGGANNGKDGV